MVGNWGIGLFVLLLLLPGILFFVLAAALFPVTPAAGVALVVLGLLYLALASAAGSALHGIYLGALYQFAAFGRIPDGFNRYAMEGAFRRK